LAKLQAIAPGILLRQTSAQRGSPARDGSVSRPNKPATELVGLNNPFAKLKVYDRAKLDLLRGAPTDDLFGMVAADRGLVAALAAFPPSARAEIMEKVQATAAQFWKPEEFWAGWADEVRRGLPPEGLP
jgi:hypothetical protein